MERRYSAPRDGTLRVISFGTSVDNFIDNHWLIKLMETDNVGIRGLSSLFILQSLMRDLNRKVSLSEPLEPWQVFDMIGGSGIGG